MWKCEIKHQFDVYLNKRVKWVLQRFLCKSWVRVDIWEAAVHLQPFYCDCNCLPSWIKSLSMKFLMISYSVFQVRFLQEAKVYKAANKESMYAMMVIVSILKKGEVKIVFVAWFPWDRFHNTDPPSNSKPSPRWWIRRNGGICNPYGLAINYIKSKINMTFKIPLLLQS